MSHFYLVCRQCCLSISSQLQCKNMRLCHRIHWDTDHLEASVVTDLSLKTLIPQRTSEQIMSNTLQGVTYRHCGNDVGGWDFSLMCPPAIVKPPCSISFSSLKYKYWHVYQIHMIRTRLATTVMIILRINYQYFMGESLVRPVLYLMREFNELSSFAENNGTQMQVTKINNHVMYWPILGFSCPFWHPVSLLCYMKWIVPVCAMGK